MPKTRKPNQQRNSKSRDARQKIVSLVGEVEDALGAARAFGMALELMSLGYRELRDDYSDALMTVTENVLRHIESARRHCTQILTEVGP